MFDKPGHAHNPPRYCLEHRGKKWRDEFRRRKYRLTHPWKAISKYSPIDQNNYILRHGRLYKPHLCNCIVCKKEFISWRSNGKYCPQCQPLINKKIKLISPLGFKYCSKCGKLKSLDTFKKCKRNRDGYASACKDCDRRDPQRRRIWEKNKSQIDPKFRLHRTMRTMIWCSLKGKNGKNGHPWESLVGYTVQDLKRHLEKLFLSGMNWNNYGHGKNCWSIDHVIPKSIFNFKDPRDLDFQRCWNLKNLQPLWNIDNISKSNKLEKSFQPSLSYS